MLPNDEFVWYHQDSPPQDHSIAKGIEKKMRSCTGVIWIETETSRSREWVTWEVDNALRLGLPVYSLNPHQNEFQKLNDQPVPFHLFPSYAHADREKVGPVLTRLRKTRGVSIFLDHEDLALSSNIQDRVQRELDRATSGYGFLLLFASEKALASKMVEAELTQVLANADRNKLLVLPVSVTSGAVEQLLESHPWFTHRNWPKDWVVNLSNCSVERATDEIMVKAYGFAYRNAGKR